MGAVPQWAPAGENHLLRSSSIAQKVKYGERSVEYRTFDQDATEVLRLNFKPSRIRAGGAALSERHDLEGEGYTLDALQSGDYVLPVRHTTSNQIAVAGKYRRNRGTMT